MESVISELQIEQITFSDGSGCAPRRLRANELISPWYFSIAASQCLPSLTKDRMPAVNENHSPQCINTYNTMQYISLRIPEAFGAFFDALRSISKSSRESRRTRGTFRTGAFRVFRLWLEPLPTLRAFRRRLRTFRLRFVVTSGGDVGSSISVVFTSIGIACISET